MSTERQANKLIHKKSLYEIQHAYNPLDWTETTCPQKWLHNGEVVTFPWFE